MQLHFIRQVNGVWSIPKMHLSLRQRARLSRTSISSGSGSQPKLKRTRIRQQMKVHQYCGSSISINKSWIFMQMMKTRQPFAQQILTVFSGRAVWQLLTQGLNQTRSFVRHYELLLSSVGIMRSVRWRDFSSQRSFVLKAQPKLE